MINLVHRLLNRPELYYGMRHWFLGGLPFRRWVTLYGLDETQQRIADLGCGPADVLRYVPHQSLPAFYLGVDFDCFYLERAQQRAAKIGLNCEFVNIDLRELTRNESVRNQLIQLLAEHKITRVLLLGVLHHISDAAVESTMELLFKLPCVQTVVTQDVLFMPGHPVNNFLAKRDRGEFVRTQSEYEIVLKKTSWPTRKLFWSQAGSRCAQYIHFQLSRDLITAPTE